MDLWNIEQCSYESGKNKRYETIFTLANGYRGLRGHLEFSKEGQVGNFISGIYDGWNEDVTEIVNCPDPIGLDIYSDDEKIDLDNNGILEFNRTLDMQRGILKLRFIIKLSKGKMVKIKSERFVSRQNVHRWAAKYTIQPLNFKGKFNIYNIIDGNTANKAFDAENKVKHYRIKKFEDLNPGISLQVITMDVGLKIVETTSLQLPEKGEELIADRKFSINQNQGIEKYEIHLKSKQEYTFYKYGNTYTQRETDGDILKVAIEDHNSFLSKGYENELKDHINVWVKIWRDIDIKIEGDDIAQRAVRFNLFHLASSAYSGDTKVSIAAKALHGEGYKGHIFWDTEIFMLPFFTYCEPEVAKTLLMYRYNTLEAAKEKAREKGFQGAQYPWESADTGVEVTPKLGRNFDGSIIQIYTGEEEFHINSDIVYAIMEYYKASRDEKFLLNYGLKMIFETTKFWNSIVEYNDKKDRYEINKVIGPDEFHEHINNNVYTNYLAKWSINNALKLVEWIKNKDKNIFTKLCKEICVNENDIENWRTIEKKLYIPRGKDGKLIEQFEGYFMLQDIIIKEYDINGMPIWPGNVEIKDIWNTQLIKQADVIMLLYLLSEEFDYNTKKINYEYYEKRTMHKSSLSPSIYSIMGLSVGDTKNAYKYFMKTALTDLDDNQGNTAEGLHAAATGGVWQTIVFGFAGMNIEDNGMVSFNPWLPPKWNNLSFNIKLNSKNLKVTIEKERLLLHSDTKRTVKVNGKIYNLIEKETFIVN